MDNLTTTTSLQALGITSSLILGGVYFGSSQLTAPILFRLEPVVAVSIFSEFYYRGAATVVPLALVASTSYGAAAYYEPTKRRRLILGIVAVLSALAWTRLVMAKHIDRLLEAEKSAAVLQKMGGEQVVYCLRQWHWQNFVRAATSLAGGVLGLWTLIQ
jgi:hypothetical protein